MVKWSTCGDISALYGHNLRTFFCWQDFRKLVASFTAKQVFAVVSNFRERYKRFMTAYSKKIRSRIIFCGKFPSGFDNVVFLCLKCI